jgi:peptidyl-prolyl cis-trans isomerase SurA
MRFLCLLLLAQLASAEIIDRIAATVGYSVITEAEILRQIRLTAFQNGDPPDFSPGNRRKTAEKLVEQILIRKEVEANKYALPESSKADAMFASIKATFPSDAAYRKALADYQITETDLKQQLQWQATLLSFIEVRFRPGVQVPDQEIRDYYERHLLPEWEKTHPGTSNLSPPTLQESRDAIENILAGQRADQALDRWLGQSRTQTQILYRNEVFQ